MMKTLKNYLEYLTLKEQKKAFEGGQTNLDPKIREEDKNIEPPKPKEIPEWIYKSSDDVDLKQWMATDSKEKFIFKKNVKINKNGARLVLLDDGNFYSANPNGKVRNGIEPVHYSILGYIVKNFLSKKITKEEYQNWEMNPPKHFICLMYYGGGYYLAESYYTSDYWNFKIQDKWNRIAIIAGLNEINFEDFEEPR